MRLAKILKFASLALLALSGSKASAACVKSKVENIDYFCGEDQIHFQPCEDFELVGGTAIQSTTLWMLGEIHVHKERTIQCIENLTENNKEHIIYLEGVEAGTKVNCEERGFKDKPNRTCMGWDDMQAVREYRALPSTTDIIEKNITQQCIAKLHSMYGKNSDKSIREDLTKMQKKYKQLTGKSAEQYYALNMLEALDWLLTENLKGSSFSDLFARRKEYKGSTKKLLNSEEAKKVREINHRRNSSQMKLLAKHPKDILGLSCDGLFHLVKQDNDDIHDSEYVRNELAKGPHQNSYAVLAMK